MKCDVIEAVIEIPMGTKNKYEVDKKTNKIKLDRVLYGSLTYPGEYGYINETLSDDGDPLDILVISSYPTFPGCIVDARVVGYLKVIDDGKGDEKVIAVSDKDPRFNEILTLDDITIQQKNEIKDFFQHYKYLQKVKVEALDYYGLTETLDLIKLAQANYKKSQVN